MWGGARSFKLQQIGMMVTKAGGDGEERDGLAKGYMQSYSYFRNPGHSRRQSELLCILQNSRMAGN